MTDSNEAGSGVGGGQVEASVGGGGFGNSDDDGHRVQQLNQQPNMKHILDTIQSDCPSYEEVTGQQSLGIEAGDETATALRLSPMLSASSTCGKTTCVQMKPGGHEVDIVGNSSNLKFSAIFS
jgi:hypothetical protein